MDPASANAEARRIQGRALAHKQRAARERGRMRRELRKLDEFRVMCAEFGITLVIEGEVQRNHTETLRRSQSDDTQGSS
jgi:hypothetical protein